MVEATADGRVRVIKSVADGTSQVISAYLVAASPYGAIVNGVSEGLRVVLEDPETGAVTPVEVQPEAGD